jgi:hypothetical protein
MKSLPVVLTTFPVPRARREALSGRWRPRAAGARWTPAPPTAPTELHIGAAQLGDVRMAIIELYRDELDAVRDEYERLGADGDRPLGEDGAARLAAARSRLTAATVRFDRILRCGQETTVTSEPQALAQLLQETVQVLSGRLASLAERRPVPMRAVLDLTERMRWAAGEAIRIDPRLGRGRA